MNWVEAEVDLALSRAHDRQADPLLFIPVLADKSTGSSALPPFAKRYQGVRDPLGQGEELEKLLKAVLDADWDKPVRLIDEPFVGLRSMREEEADRFFGRDAEIAELGEKFRQHRIVAIVADSGTGKSSLAEAGFAPAFRGGALADPARERARRSRLACRHDAAARQSGRGPAHGVSEAAEKLGRSPDERASLRTAHRARRPERDRLCAAMRPAGGQDCDAPDRRPVRGAVHRDAGRARRSLRRAPAGLADGDKDIRILLTVRADYFNLASGVKDAAGEASEAPTARPCSSASTPTAAMRSCG